MKYNYVIMNPPYKGDLHLKILNKCMEHTSSQIVNLSPVLWLEFPKREETSFIDGVIDSLEVIKASDARKYFCARNQTDLGIYSLDMRGGKKTIEDYSPFQLRGYKNAYEIQNIWHKTMIKMPSNIKEHISRRNDPMKGYCIVFSHMSGLNSNHDFVYTDGIGENGKSYKENVRNQHKNETSHHLTFSTYEEADNFRKSLHTKFMKFIIKIGQPGLIYIMDTIPYMIDYTKKWGDEEFYKYFDITENEIKIIEGIIG